MNLPAPDSTQRTRTLIETGLQEAHYLRRTDDRLFALPLKGIALGTGSGVATDRSVGLLQRVDQPKRGGFCAFAHAVGDRIVYIPLGLFTRDDRFGRHALVPGLVLWRTR